MKNFLIYEIISVSLASIIFLGQPTTFNAGVDAETTEETTEPEETTVEETELVTETEPETETTVEETTEPETTVPETTEPEPEPEPEPYIKLTEEERRIFATLIRLEAGGTSYECQMAVGSVVLNRMKAWNLTLEQVIFAKNQFSPAYLINYKKNGDYVYKPYKKSYQVVDDLCMNGPSLPYYVCYFRAKRHHKWAIPYCEIDGTYFSYVKRDL